MDTEKIRLKDWFVGPAKRPIVEFFRSLFVGGISFLFDFFPMVFFREVAGLSVFWSATLGFVIGVSVNYLLSVLWVFKQSNVKSATTRFAIFVVIAAVGLLFNYAIIWLFEVPMAQNAVLGSWLKPEHYYMVGKVVATLVVFLWNFFSRKILLFRDSTKKQATQEEK